MSPPGWCPARALCRGRWSSLRFRPDAADRLLAGLSHRTRLTLSMLSGGATSRDGALTQLRLWPRHSSHLAGVDWRRIPRSGLQRGDVRAHLPSRAVAERQGLRERIYWNDAGTVLSLNGVPLTGAPG